MADSMFRFMRERRFQVSSELSALEFVHHSQAAIQLCCGVIRIGLLHHHRRERRDVGLQVNHKTDERGGFG